MRSLVGLTAAFLLLAATSVAGQVAPQKTDEEILDRAEGLAAEDIPELLSKAEEGDGEAQLLLALAYNYGYGAEQNYAEAAKWSKKAADQGFAQAQDLLGVLYFLGQGVERNESEAVKWLRKAAEQEFPKGEYHLGVTYMQGKGVKQDFKEAVKWFRRAAEKGVSNAQANLGSMYFNGSGVKRNLREAMRWYLRAAEQLNDAALANLGEIALVEKGDEAEAYKWFTLAAQAGHERAKAELVGLKSKLRQEQIAKAEQGVQDWLALCKKSAMEGLEVDPSLKALDPDQVLKQWDEDTPGVKLSMREAERMQLSGKTRVNYEVTASWFPAGKWYVLWAWRLLAGKPEVVAAGFQVDPQGGVGCAPKPPGWRRARRWLPWCWGSLEKYLSGLDSVRAAEPFRLALMSSDLAIRGSAKEIPIPIEAHDGPCRLSVELASATGEMFAVWGKGFEPGEEATSTIAFDGEATPEQKQKVSDTGKSLHLILPGEVGEQSGWWTLTVTGKQCKVTVKHEWGPPAMQVR